MNEILPEDAPPYALLGGEAAVQRLVNRFYDIMDSDPVAAMVRGLHGADLASAREKLFLFLCGWLGGPPLYVDKYGHPMLRARHLPFTINERARDEWLYCMYKALDEEIPDNAPLKAHLEQAFLRTADFMRNTQG